VPNQSLKEGLHNTRHRVRGVGLRDKLADHGFVQSMSSPGKLNEQDIEPARCARTVIDWIGLSANGKS
jgi:hypothetical protein